MLPVLITYCNFGYIDFAKNLILSLAKVLKHHKLDFYCLDRETYDELSEEKHNFLTVRLFEQNVSSDFEIYNSPKYKQLTHTKTNVLRDALNRHSFIHFIDCDIVCLNEPTVHHYSRYAAYDVVFQYDWVFENNIAKQYFGIWQCTGNMTLRRNIRVLDLIYKLEEYQRKHRDKNDQVCLLGLFTLLRISDIRKYRPTRLFVYPPEEYTNGSWKGDTSRIYFFHANHVSGKEDKINLLKNLNQWFL
jgi:hypothetical protein